AVPEREDSAALEIVAPGFADVGRAVRKVVAALTVAPAILEFADVLRAIRQRQFSAPAVLVVLERAHVKESVGRAVCAFAVKAAVPETTDVLLAVAICEGALAAADRRLPRRHI